MGSDELRLSPPTVDETPDRVVLCPATSWRRFSAIVLSTAGVFTAISVADLVRGLPPSIMISTQGILWMLLRELLMAAYWVPRLRRDGWRLSHLTLPFSPVDVLRGIVLYVASTVFYVLVWVAVALLAPGFVHRAAAVHMGGALSWWAAALLVIINPVAEESLYLGVVANVLRSRSYAAALFVSVLVQVAVHLYQGPLALLAIAPLGLISTTYYLDTRRMWPPVIAHAITDIVALRHWVTWAA